MMALAFVAQLAMLTAITAKAQYHSSDHFSFGLGDIAQAQAREHRRCGSVNGHVLLLVRKAFPFVA